MGMFVNSGNAAFQVALNSEIYVDKTGLLNYTNHVMDTTSKFICNSRPRRFGKSITADMLTAYYSKGCDSTEMFSNLEIGKSANFETQYDVHSASGYPSGAWNQLAVGILRYSGADNQETQEYYHERAIITSLPEALLSYQCSNRKKFIVIMDE